MYQLGQVRNDYGSFQQLVSFYNEYKNVSFSDIYLNISGYFAANQSATLGVILEQLSFNINDIYISVTQGKTQEILQKNGFLLNYGFTSVEDNNNTTIPFRKFTRTESKIFTEYIRKELMPRNEMPEMSDNLKLSILGAIGEIFANSSMHTDSPFIIACGQFYPKAHILDFTIADMGGGIRPNVCNYLKKEINAIDAIKWAIIDGNTTKQGAPGGYGLSILRELIKLNKGFMQVVSNNGFYEYSSDSKNEKSKVLTYDFPGTVINLQFRTDDSSSYCLKQEIKD